MQNTNNAQTHVFTSFPETAQDEDTDHLIQQDEDQKNFLNETNYSFYQMEYYQKYFNVNTNDVLIRILGSMTPTISQNFLLNKIRPNPDLYGPFWISITLIFTIAISGNIFNYLQTFGQDYKWQTDFDKVTSSAAAILTYWWFVPTILYVLMKWRQIVTDFTFIEMLCIYGYSLSVYIPVCVMWLIEIRSLQWILALIALFLSGSVLVLTFWPVFSQDNNKTIAFLIMGSIFVLHGVLAISFMVYFFRFQIPASNLPHDTVKNSTLLKNSTLG